MVSSTIQQGVARRGRERSSQARVSWVALCLLWAARRRERRVLGGLDERLLRDIGASRSDAAREAALPFWRR